VSEGVDGAVGEVGGRWLAPEERCGWRQAVAVVVVVVVVVVVGMGVVEAVDGGRRGGAGSASGRCERSCAPV
jgi:hypothetical protein